MKGRRCRICDETSEACVGFDDGERCCRWCNGVEVDEHDTHTAEPDDPDTFRPSPAERLAVLEAEVERLKIQLRTLGLEG